MSTRPRIDFDGEGKCNACRWALEKKNIDWDSRELELKELLSKHRGGKDKFDCLVPMSGGKDGSYVAYKLKHEYGMNPLGITVTPPLPTSLGEENLRSFVKSGYNHISVNPDYSAMTALNKIGFIEMGFPYYGWLVAIFTAPIRIAKQFGIGLIVYGEDGEVEYGGTNETAKNPIFDFEYQRTIYMEGGYNRVLNSVNLTEDQKYFFVYPEETDFRLDLTHWSYFENWDPYRNYVVAKTHCGLKEADSSNAGTFTNFAQNDQKFYALHTYMMFLKYGFGRANQDACIEIRRGAMDRDQAINLVKLYDGHFPEEFIDDYLDYYQMDRSEFDDVLDHYANKALFEKYEGRWRPKFEIV